ncbi:MAG: TetR family transcriptional regulator [Alphaproteobacteria bacterium]|nr:TetR family transcriptional regulator [Alphaproteobacteria bacterium]
MNASTDITASPSQSRKSDRTRQTILDAAAKLFREQGYRATTLRQIAGRAKIKAGSIYYYFDSKDQILDEVLELGIRVIHEAVEKAVADLPEKTSGRMRIETAVATHLHTVLQYNDYASANIQNIRHVSLAARNRNKDLRRAYAEYWHDLFDVAKRAGEIGKNVDLSIARLFLLGALNSTIDWYDPKQGSTKRLAENFCNMFFEGSEP